MIDIEDRGPFSAVDSQRCALRSAGAARAGTLRRRRLRRQRRGRGGGFVHERREAVPLFECGARVSPATNAHAVEHQDLGEDRQTDRRFEAVSLPVCGISVSMDAPS